MTVPCVSGLVSEFYCDVFQNGTKVATLDISDGTVTQDFNASSRRTVDLTFTAWGAFAGRGSLIPTVDVKGKDARYGDALFGSGIFGDSIYDLLRSLITPLVTSVKVYGDYSWPGGSETDLLGTFTLGDPAWDQTAQGVTVTVSGWDAGTDLAATKFRYPTTTNLSPKTTQAISVVLSQVLPKTLKLDLPAGTVTPAFANYVPGNGQSPWGVAQQLADLESWKLYVTRDGDTIKAATVPEAGAYPAPVYAFTDDTNLFKATLETTSRDVCNVVVVSGDNPKGDTIWARVEQSTGPFGTATTGRYIVKEYSSELAGTKTALFNLAMTLLRKWSRLGERVTADCWPAPHLEVGDVVSIASADLGLDTDTWMLEQITLPLNPTGLMQFTASRSLR